MSSAVSKFCNTLQRSAFSQQKDSLVHIILKRCIIVVYEDRQSTLQGKRKEQSQKNPKIRCNGMQTKNNQEGEKKPD